MSDEDDQKQDSEERVPDAQEIEAWHQRQDDADRTDTSSTLAPLQNASPQDWLGSNQDPDVMLAIPNLGVDHIGLTVDNLKAHVELHAKVLDLLELHVGADASIEKVDLEIDNVRVQAMLKVRLDKVVDIVSRVMDTIDAHPEILSNLTAGLGEGLKGALDRPASEQEGITQGGEMTNQPTEQPDAPDQPEQPDQPDAPDQVEGDETNESDQGKKSEQE